jgi:pyruvate dehydrogenase (quinone)/pyruvate oxidase
MSLGDLATFTKYKLPVKFIVIKNNTLGQIKWEQMVFLGNPEYGVALQPIDFVKVAEACGGTGFHVENAGDLPSTLQSFLATDGPALLEALVDPFEPPMPPMITFDQAERMGEALARGEANRGKIALTLFRDRIDDFAATASGPLEQIAEKVADVVGGDSKHGSRSRTPSPSGRG